MQSGATNQNRWIQENYLSMQCLPIVEGERIDSLKEDRGSHPGNTDHVLVIRGAEQPSVAQGEGSGELCPRRSIKGERLLWGWIDGIYPLCWIGTCITSTEKRSRTTPKHLRERQGKKAKGVCFLLCMYITGREEVLFQQIKAETPTFFVSYP